MKLKSQSDDFDNNKDSDIFSDKIKTINTVLIDD